MQQPQTDLLYPEKISDSLGDGIRIYMVKLENSFQRGLAVRKMRGTDHETDIVPLKISTGGISVFPDQELFADV